MKRTQSDSLKMHAKPGPIIDAARDLLRQPVPGDAQGRTFSEMIAATLVERAFRGNLQALRELREATASGECENCRWNKQVVEASDEKLDLIMETYLEKRAKSGGPIQQRLHFPVSTA